MHVFEPTGQPYTESILPSVFLQRAPLKIGFPRDREFQTEGEALAVFEGKGIEKLLQADKDHAVLLLERVIPGVPLITLEDDEEATRILASVMKHLWKPLPEKHDFITIAEWSNAISQYHGTSGPLPSYLVDKAERLFAELIGSSAEPVMVHGDLHHENVLSSARAGWLAIDPKGVAAEPAYETAALLRNPRSKLQQHPELEQILLPFSYSNVCKHPRAASCSGLSSPTAITREPLDQPSRFGLTSAPQAFNVTVVATTQDGQLEPLLVGPVQRDLYSAWLAAHLNLPDTIPSIAHDEWEGAGLGGELRLQAAIEVLAQRGV